MDDAGGSITFVHTIAEGTAGRSFGVHVGRMAGLPKAVHERAAEILGQLEASGAAVPDSLTDLIQAPRRIRRCSPRCSWRYTPRCRPSANSM